jgi:hypothetical protein
MRYTQIVLGKRTVMCRPADVAAVRVNYAAHRKNLRKNLRASGRDLYNTVLADIADERTPVDIAGWRALMKEARALLVTP